LNLRQGQVRSWHQIVKQAADCGGPTLFRAVSLLSREPDRCRNGAMMTTRTIIMYGFVHKNFQGLSRPNSPDSHPAALDGAPPRQPKVGRSRSRYCLSISISRVCRSSRWRRNRPISRSRNSCSDIRARIGDGSARPATLAVSDIACQRQLTPRAFQLLQLMLARL
jgi:hypothetical protein